MNHRWLAAPSFKNLKTLYSLRCVVKSVLLVLCARSAPSAPLVSTVVTVSLVLMRPWWATLKALATCAVCTAAGVLLTACASGPKTADWQIEARSAIDRSVAAWLEGNSRVAGLELNRARSALSSTGRIDLLARAELLHCAGHVASLVFQPCTGFERLRQDAAPAERAYADYLAGTLSAKDAALLPSTQRVALNSSSLAGIEEPLSQLVAAGALFRRGQASPALLQQAVDIASTQGWRRPLLAWLGVQAALAEKEGRVDEAARLRRRIALSQ